MTVVTPSICSHFGDTLKMVPFTDRGPYGNPFKLDNFTSAMTFTLNGVASLTESYMIQIPLPTSSLPHYPTERHNLTCDNHPEDDFMSAFNDDLTDIDAERARYCGYDARHTP